MSNFGFAFASFSVTTILGGSVTTSIKVPGIFGGIVPADPTAGRYLKSITLWCDSFISGDALTLLQIVDTDGVVPVGQQPAFPNYPVIFDLLDVVGGAQSLQIPPTQTEFDVFDPSGNPSVKFLPSQLYLKLTFTSGGLSIGKTLRGLIRWGLWQ